MRKKNNFFTDNIPSSCKSILHSLKGTSINRLIRCSWDKFSEFDLDNLYNISKTDFFRLTSGAIVIQLENGVEIGVYSQEDLNSIIIWGERNIDGEISDDYYKNDNVLIENNNTDYTTIRENKLSLQQIQSVEILKVPPKSDKYKELPNEIGLLFQLGNGEELVFSHNLISASDSFSIAYSDELQGYRRNDFMSIDLL